MAATAQEQLDAINDRIEALAKGTAVEGLTVGEETYRYSSLASLIKSRDLLQQQVQAESNTGGVQFYATQIDTGI